MLHTSLCPPASKQASRCLEAQGRGLPSAAAGILTSSTALLPVSLAPAGSRRAGRAALRGTRGQPLRSSLSSRSA